jgi:predicted DNA-binding transcriptional regulator AlpA
MKQLIRRAQLRQLLGGVSDSTIDRWEHKGILPKRIIIWRCPKTGRPLVVAWYLDEVEEAIRKMPTLTPSWVARETEPVE